MFVGYGKVFFFLDVTRSLVGYLEVRSVLVLRTVSKAIGNFILEAHPQEFSFSRKDVFEHLSSFTTESQAFWVLRQLQYWKKLVPFMPVLRLLRKKKKRERQERGAGTIFQEMFAFFCSRQHQIYLLNIAVKFDSVRLLRMVAIEVHARSKRTIILIMQKTRQ
jgi:hypothetical protein